MIKPTKSLIDLYYFINDDVIYNISSSNDKDECGEKKVVYTENNKIDWVASADIFPSFKVSYTVENNETIDVYYFLQNLIEDGDKFVGGEFVNQHPQKDEDGEPLSPIPSYLDLFNDSVKQDISIYVDRGYTVEKIKQLLPGYIFAIGEEDECVTFCDNDGKKYTGKLSGVEGIATYDDGDIMELVYKTLNEKAKEYTNGILKPYGKQLKKEVDIVIEENIEDIDGVNRTITYTASSKLNETTSLNDNGLHTNAFNTTIKSHTFENGTGTIEFNDNVTSIGDSAFMGCSGLTNITIPNTVTSINTGAFNNSGLTIVTIPDSVTIIGVAAFESCNSLASVIIEAVTPPTLDGGGSTAFLNNANDRKIYVPAESVEVYKTATNWSNYANDIQAIP